MNQINLTIDSIDVAVNQGTTILQAARQIGIEIPTLCHLDGKPSDIPCELCVVEKKGQDNLIRSCKTLAQEGFAIITASEEIIAHRQLRLSIFGYKGLLHRCGRKFGP